jgi:hypothetical protein
VLLGAIGLAAIRTDFLGLAALAGLAAFLGLSANVIIARGAARRRRTLGSPSAP